MIGRSSPSPEYKTLPFSAIISVIAQFIKENNYFLITTHIDSDADGLGAQVGFFFLIKNLGKEIKVYNHEKINENIEFMIPREFLDAYQYADESSRERDFAFFDEYLNKARLLILDNSEVNRLGYLGEYTRMKKIPWWSIDHHDLTPVEHILVDSEYASTCEIIWDVYRFMGISIDPEAARALYAGMVADTGNFRYPKTSLRTHIAAGELLMHGINPNEIFRKFYEDSPVKRLQVFSDMVTNARINTDRKYIIAELTQDLKKKYSLASGESEGMVNQFLAYRDIELAVLIRETDTGTLKASLRSTKEINVAEFAERFNGGGHKNAAGLAMDEPYLPAKEKLIRALMDFMN